MMDKVTHTPGPWLVGRLGISIKILPGTFDGLPVATVTSQRPAAVREANAHLIAAAPELLDQLKSAERWLAEMHSESDGGEITELREVHPDAWECIDKMRAAIAKAQEPSNG